MADPELGEVRDQPARVGKGQRRPQLQAVRRRAADAASSALSSTVFASRSTASVAVPGEAAAAALAPRRTRLLRELPPEREQLAIERIGRPRVELRAEERLLRLRVGEASPAKEANAANSRLRPSAAAAATRDPRGR